MEKQSNSQKPGTNQTTEGRLRGGNREQKGAPGQAQESSATAHQSSHIASSASIN
jgi:hypothetical protein